MSLGPRDGVLLVAHGTVENLDDMPEFLARIRHGRKASEALVQELVRRYTAIGGSPLLDITRAQANALARRIDGPVLVGMRLWQPSVEQALLGCAELGLSRVCVLPLAPFSVHVYWAAALEAASRISAELGPRAPRLVSAAAWGTEPDFVLAHAQRILPELRKAGWENAALVLSAHSLPASVIRAGDPYQEQALACAAAIGAELGRDYRVAFQSQGADGGEWIGPDLKSVLQAYRAEGQRKIVLAPFGFLADHVETLYDLDIEAKSWADEMGVEIARVPALNVNAKLVEALAQVVERAFAELGP